MSSSAADDFVFPVDTDLPEGGRSTAALLVISQQLQSVQYLYRGKVVRQIAFKQITDVQMTDPSEVTLSTSTMGVLDHHVDAVVIRDSIYRILRGVVFGELLAAAGEFDFPKPRVWAKQKVLRYLDNEMEDRTIFLTDGRLIVYVDENSHMLTTVSAKARNAVNIPKFAEAVILLCYAECERADNNQIIIRSKDEEIFQFQSSEEQDTWVGLLATAIVKASSRKRISDENKDSKRGSAGDISSPPAVNGAIAKSPNGVSTALKSNPSASGPLSPSGSGFRPPVRRQPSATSSTTFASPSLADGPPPTFDFKSASASSTSGRSAVVSASGKPVPVAAAAAAAVATSKATQSSVAPSVFSPAAGPRVVETCRSCGRVRANDERGVEKFCVHCGQKFVATPKSTPSKLATSSISSPPVSYAAAAARPAGSPSSLNHAKAPQSQPAQNSADSSSDTPPTEARVLRNNSSSTEVGHTRKQSGAKMHTRKTSGATSKQPSFSYSSDSASAQSTTAVQSAATKGKSVTPTRRTATPTKRSTTPTTLSTAEVPNGYVLPPSPRAGATPLPAMAISPPQPFARRVTPGKETPLVAVPKPKALAVEAADLVSSPSPRMAPPSPPASPPPPPPDSTPPNSPPPPPPSSLPPSPALVAINLIPPPPSEPAFPEILNASLARLPRSPQIPLSSLPAPKSSAEVKRPMEDDPEPRSSQKSTSKPINQFKPDVILELSRKTAFVEDSEPKSSQKSTSKPKPEVNQFKSDVILELSRKTAPIEDDSEPTFSQKLPKPKPEVNQSKSDVILELSRKAPGLPARQPSPAKESSQQRQPSPAKLAPTLPPREGEPAPKPLSVVPERQPSPKSHVKSQSPGQAPALPSRQAIIGELPALSAVSQREPSPRKGPTLPRRQSGVPEESKRPQLEGELARFGEKSPVGEMSPPFGGRPRATFGEKSPEMGRKSLREGELSPSPEPRTEVEHPRPELEAPTPQLVTVQRQQTPTKRKPSPSPRQQASDLQKAGPFAPPSLPQLLESSAALKAAPQSAAQAASQSSQQQPLFVLKQTPSQTSASLSSSTPSPSSVAVPEQKPAVAPVTVVPPPAATVAPKVVAPEPLIVPPPAVPVVPATVPVVSQPVVEQPKKYALTVLLDGHEEPLGVVHVTRTHTLAATRDLINSELDWVPPEFQFVHKGAPVGKKQEDKRTAVEVLPSVMIRVPSAAPVVSSPPRPTPPEIVQQTVQPVKAHQVNITYTIKLRGQTDPIGMILVQQPEGKSLADLRGLIAHDLAEEAPTSFQFIICDVPVGVRQEATRLLSELPPGPVIIKAKDGAGASGIGSPTLSSPAMSPPPTVGSPPWQDKQRSASSSLDLSGAPTPPTPPNMPRGLEASGVAESSPIAPPAPMVPEATGPTVETKEDGGGFTGLQAALLERQSKLKSTPRGGGVAVQGKRMSGFGSDALFASMQSAMEMRRDQLVEMSLPTSPTGSLLSAPMSMSDHWELDES